MFQFVILPDCLTVLLENVWTSHTLIRWIDHRRFRSVGFRRFFGKEKQEQSRQDCWIPISHQKKDGIDEMVSPRLCSPSLPLSLEADAAADHWHCRLSRATITSISLTKTNKYTRRRWDRWEEPAVNAPHRPYLDAMEKRWQSCPRQTWKPFLHHWKETLAPSLQRFVSTGWRPRRNERYCTAHTQVLLLKKPIHTINPPPTTSTTNSIYQRRCHDKYNQQRLRPCNGQQSYQQIHDH